MKGVIFNLLEEVVRRSHGEDTWDRLLDEASVTAGRLGMGGLEPALHQVRAI